ncbi:hypothetical protein KL927_002254 [Ogataea polymorpha]|nr:hypothetical protein KL927_002254 [Ogataea polymorpha]
MASSLSSFEAKTTVPPSRIGTFFNDVLANFHPIYFVINMGLGITSLVMYNFPIEVIRVGMRYVGILYFFIDLVAFIIIHALFFLRYFVLFNRYDRVSFWGLLKDHRLSVFLGAEVMGFGSLINMIHYLRPEWTLFTYTLWWIQVALRCIRHTAQFPTIGRSSPNRASTHQGHSPAQPRVSASSGRAASAWIRLRGHVSRLNGHLRDRDRHFWGSQIRPHTQVVKDALGIDVPAGDHGRFPVRAVQSYRLAGLPNHKHHLLICFDCSHNMLSREYLHLRNTYSKA